MIKFKGSIKKNISGSTKKALLERRARLIQIPIEIPILIISIPMPWQEKL
jgi:hypothetical protein